MKAMIRLFETVMSHGADDHLFFSALQFGQRYCTLFKGSEGKGIVHDDKNLRLQDIKTTVSPC